MDYYDFQREEERRKEWERRSKMPREVRRKKEYEERDKFVAETEFTNFTQDGKIKKRKIKMGTGEFPEKGYFVDVYITGKKMNGEIFKQRDDPKKIKLGRGDVVKGVELAIYQMKQGECSEFTLAPEYAYGENGSPPNVEPNEEVLFEIEITNFYDDYKKADLSRTEKLEKFDSIKKKGLQDFQDMEYEDAVEKFEKAYNIIFDITDLNYEILGKITSALLNTCNCYIKLEKWEKVIERADYIENQIPFKNPKTHYYRGVFIKLNLDCLHVFRTL